MYILYILYMYKVYVFMYILYYYIIYLNIINNYITLICVASFSPKNRTISRGYKLTRCISKLTTTFYNFDMHSATAKKPQQYQEVAS